MPGDIFLKIGSIEGESTDQQFKGQIEVLSYSFGMSQAVTGTGSSVGSKAGQRVDIAALNFTKYLDQSSPKIMQSCCAGDNVGECVLSFRRAVKGKQELYWEYKLAECVISSVQNSGSGDGGVPVESISIVFDKATWVYTVTTDKEGAGGKLPGGWDMRTNVAAA